MRPSPSPLLSLAALSLILSGVSACQESVRRPQLSASHADKRNSGDGTNSGDGVNGGDETIDAIDDGDEGGGENGEEEGSGFEKESPLKPWIDPGAAAPQKDPTLLTQVHKYFNIHVVDKATNAGIPGAKLTTTSHIRLGTDKNGFVAFYEPGLMNTKVYFSVSHPGWEIPKDAFGNSGAALDIKEGGASFIYMQKTTGQTVPVTHDRDTRLILGGNVALPSQIFGLRVVDKATKRGVPLVRMLLPSGDEYWTDNQGFIAFTDIDKLGSELDAKFNSDGYDSFEAKVKAEKGKEITFEISRRNIAERLYRSTGAGSYRDSVMLGYQVPVKNPHIDGLVMGQDTLNAIVYKSKIFWIWQDTHRAAYTLGNFNNSGAVSDLPSAGNISQDLGINRQYYVDGDGFSRAMTPGFEPSNEPTWMGSLVALPNANGQEKMYGIYGKATGLADIGKRGWGVYDDASNTFKDVVNFAKAEYIPGQLLTPNADPVKVRHGSKDYLYYGSMRVPATVENLLNIDAYETYSPYQSKTKTPVKNVDGSFVYAWRKNAYPSEPEEMKKAGYAADDILDEKEFRDMSGKGVGLAAGSLEKNWNEYRKRYLGTIQQRLGTSLLGESWIAEADTPMGPWNFATKVISHDKYTFYNLQQHPFYDREGGRLIYIHGTYTNFFTSEVATPRYDYNQVLYRVDLADSRLTMPVAVYDLDTKNRGHFATKSDLHPGSTPLSASFFAMDSKANGTLGLSWSAPSCNAARRLIPTSGEPSAFFVLPTDTAESAVTQKLYEFKNSENHYAYSVENEVSGFTKSANPIGLVWKSSTKVKLPVGEYLGDLKAHAGDDQCVKSEGGVARVTLNGKLSQQLSEPIKSYEWTIRSEDLLKKATGIEAVVELPNGLYFVELKVTDGKGVESTDRAMIEITE